MAEGTELMIVDNICNRVYIIIGQHGQLEMSLWQKANMYMQCIGMIFRFLILK